MEWKTVKLGEVADVKGGKRLPKGVSLISQPNKHPYIRIRDIGASKYLELTQDYEYVDDVTQQSIKRYIVNTNDILLSIVGTIGLVGVVGETLNYANQTENCVKINNLHGIDRDYLYYYLVSSLGQQEIKLGTVGAVQAKLPLKNVQSISIPLPSLDDQRRIAAILSSLDDKIENNNRINRNLEAQAQALFKSWFVDFEPFGGIMPEDWKEGNLLDIADLYDHKRIPLSGMQRDKMEKIYPYYGATSIMDYVDDYLFDGVYLLMGEDGSVMTDKGYPYLQYVEGKFWCNNHAHIMQGKNGYTTEMLYCLLNRTNVTGIVTGAVQGKISQASMKMIPVILPTTNVCADMSDKLTPYFDEMRSLRRESARLAKLRDTLLPKLMKGEINI